MLIQCDNKGDTMSAAKGNPVVYAKAQRKYDSDADVPDEKIVEGLTKLSVSVFASEDESDV